MSCDAFPDGIPQPILYSEADHRKEYEGDLGLQFVPIDKKDAVYAADLFRQRNAEFAYDLNEKRDWHGRWSKIASEVRDFKEYSKEWDEPVIADAYKDWADSLDNTQRRAIGWYKGIGYQGINRYLRGKPAKAATIKPGEMLALNPEGENFERSFIAAIDSTYDDKAVAPEDVIVYRSGRMMDESGDAYWELGEVLLDLGYVSTSLSPVQAASFKGTLMAIEVPKGSQAAYLPVLGGIKSEQEVLLPRGAVFTRVGDYQADVYDEHGDLTTQTVPRLRFLGVARKKEDLAKFGRKLIEEDGYDGDQGPAPSEAERFEWQPGDLTRIDPDDLDDTLEYAYFAYNPAEARVAKGAHGGGRWTEGGANPSTPPTSTPQDAPGATERHAKPREGDRLYPDKGGSVEGPQNGSQTRTASADVSKIEKQRAERLKSHVVGRPVIDFVRPQQLQLVQDTNAKNKPLKQWAEARGMTEEAYTEAAQKHLEGLVSRAKMARRMNQRTLPMLLKDGYVKNVFDAGMADKGKNSRDAYAELDDDVFAYPRKMRDPRKRPVYGYMTDDPDTALADSDQLFDYGDTTVVLKDDTKKRATFSFHDSAGTIAWEQYAGYFQISVVPVTRPSLEAYRQNDIDILDVPHIQDAAQHTQAHSFAYAEAQYHEGIYTEDIEYIVLPTAPDMALTSALKSAGIPWKVARKRPQRTRAEVQEAMQRHAEEGKEDGGMGVELFSEDSPPARSVDGTIITLDSAFFSEDYAEDYDVEPSKQQPSLLVRFSNALANFVFPVLSYEARKAAVAKEKRIPRGQAGGGRWVRDGSTGIASKLGGPIASISEHGGMGAAVGGQEHYERAYPTDFGPRNLGDEGLGSDPRLANNAGKDTTQGPESAMLRAYSGGRATMRQRVKESLKRVDPRNLRSWREWYYHAADLAELMAEDTGTDFNQAAIAIAAMSPQVAWGAPEWEESRALPKSKKAKNPGKWSTNQYLAYHLLQIAGGQRDNDIADITPEFAAKMAEEGIDVSNYQGMGTSRKKSWVDTAYVGRNLQGKQKFKDLPSDVLAFYTHDMVGGMDTNAMRAIRGIREQTPEYLGGPKTRSFYNNIRFPEISMDSTNDAFMARAMTGHRDLTKQEVSDLTGGGKNDIYFEFSAAVEEVAKELGWQTHEVQAVMWMQDHWESALESPGVTPDMLVNWDAIDKYSSDNYTKGIAERVDRINKSRVEHGLQPIAVSDSQIKAQKAAGLKPVPLAEWASTGFEHDSNDPTYTRRERTKTSGKK